MILKKSIFFIFLSLLIFYNYSFSQNSIYTDQDCLSCHGKSDIFQITKDGKVRSLFVDPEEWAQDIHHKGNMTCVDCHTYSNPYVHFREGVVDVDCARCHPQDAEEYQKNIHLTFAVPSANKELPLCFHCHTKHHVLLHDDPLSSIHEKNIGETCGLCHPEVMIKGILKGSSLWKISGHRKGDLAEKFDMEVCINCHYDDSAHSTRSDVKDFCSRCHDYRSKASFLMGSTHIDSIRSAWLNYVGSGLVIFFLIGAFVSIGYKSRKGIINSIKTWHARMRTEDKEVEEKKQAAQLQGPEESNQQNNE